MSPFRNSLNSKTMFAPCWYLLKTSLDQQFFIISEMWYSMYGCNIIYWAILLWWTGRPGMLRFTGLPRVGHDWATALNWTEVQKERWEIASRLRWKGWFTLDSSLWDGGEQMQQSRYKKEDYFCYYSCKAGKPLGKSTFPLTQPWHIHGSRI